MLPIRMSILEIPRADCSEDGRREPELLSQCLLCGLLLWSRAAEGEPDCRCSMSGGSQGFDKTNQLVVSPA